MFNITCRTDSWIRFAKFYEDAFDSFDPKRPVPEIDVRFYPYIGINHTIRVRKARSSSASREICRDMPAAEQHALAFILVLNFLAERCPVGPRKHIRNI